MRTQPFDKLGNDYASGNPVAVWRMLQDAGNLDGVARDKAMDVALLTMKRVRRNAERLAERLAALGWTSLTGQMVGEPEARPFPGEAEAELLGTAPLPVALLAFWQEVGSLDFVWDYNSTGPAPELFGDIPLIALDPLCVDGPERLRFALEEWRDRISIGELPATGPFRLDLAPDDYHKANVSGGSPYGVNLPDACADPLFHGDHFALRFTTYLRHSFQWGGFPGLARLPHSRAVLNRVAELAEGFEPF